MQFKLVFITTALLASASLAMSATITYFPGENCTGNKIGTLEVASGVCLTSGSGFVKSIRYSGVVKQLEFYISGGAHNTCSNGPSLVVASGSGCVNAPPG